MRQWRLAGYGPGRHYNATKAKVVGPCAYLAFSPSAHDVAGTILVSAEKRAAALDSFSFNGLVGIVRIIGALRIPRNRTACGESCIVDGTIRVARPLPDIPRHVVEAARTFLGTVPSRKRVRRICETISELTGREATKPASGNFLQQQARFDKFSLQQRASARSP